MEQKSIHRADAIRLLEDGQPHKLRLWKIATGDILTYHAATFVGAHKKAGTHRVRLEPSGVIRAFRDVTLFEIDDLSIYF